MRHGTLAVLLLLTLTLIPAPHTIHAADATVGTGTPGSCTEAALRAAVAQGGTIIFNCGDAPYTFTLSDDLVIVKDTVIDGGGPAQGGKITLSGGNRTRIISTGNALDRTQGNRAHLTVRNLTLRDGREGGGDARGGAIMGGWRSSITIINSRFENNDATASNSANAEHSGGAVFSHETTLTISDSTFVGNRGLNGGAINNLLSTLKVSNSVFTDNDATAGGGTCIPNNCFGYGGAIYTDGASWPLGNGTGGQIIIRDTLIQNNRARGQGGGAFLFVYPPDSVLVERSSFIGNSVAEDVRGQAFGGGLRQGNGDLTLRDTSFLDNRARKQGGALWRGEAGNATLTNVTMHNNQAIENEGTGRGGLGGALAGGSNGGLTCTNCTIANNRAGFQGGAVWGLGSGYTFKNTIIANNTAGNDGNNWNVKNNCGSGGTSQANDGGGNIEFPQRNLNDGQDVLCTAGALVGDPRLAAPGNNGGPTLTMALQEGSAALGRGNGCPATDQRGASRGNPCDSGAFQSGATPPSMQVPDAPELRMAPNNGSPFIRLSWNSVPGATSYQVQIGANGAFNAPPSVSTSGISTIVTATRGAVQFRARACNAVGCGSYSAPVSATITADAKVVLVPLVKR